MSSLKTDVKASDMKRSALNTTINREIFEQFKVSCKRDNVPMNTLIEAFMRQYNNGDFYLKFGREKHTNINLNDNEKDNFGETEDTLE